MTKIMKENTNTSQLNIIFCYLQSNIATVTMISKATGIQQSNITKIKSDLEKQKLIKEVRKGKCTVTGRLAWYITAKELKPIHREDNSYSNFI